MELREKMDLVMTQAIENKEVAGVSVLVMQNNNEVLYNQQGMADIEAGRPISRDTIFRYYSMSKPITAAAVMILMERGLLDLADGVSKYIPSFSDMKVYEDGNYVSAKSPITIKDLLGMTSGLVYPGETSIPEEESKKLFDEIGKRYEQGEPMDTQEIVAEIGNCPLLFQPSESWKYGTSADVLGAVVEKVSGVRLGEFLEQELFKPLGMKDTGFYIKEDAWGRFAVAYEDETLKRCHTRHLGVVYEECVAPAFESGGAGLSGTIDDYAAFANMLMNNGQYNGLQILKPATVHFMTTAQLLPWQQESLTKGWDTLRGYTYGNLMRILKEPGEAYLFGSKGEYGWDGWLGTYFCNSPKDNLTFLMMTQKKDAGTISLTRKLINLVWSELTVCD